MHRDLITVQADPDHDDIKEHFLLLYLPILFFDYTTGTFKIKSSWRHSKMRDGGRFRMKRIGMENF